MNEIYEGLIVAVLLSGSTYWPITRLVAMPIGGAILRWEAQRKPLTEEEARRRSGVYLSLLVPFFGELVVASLAFGLILAGIEWLRDRGADLLMRSTKSNSSDQP